MDEPSTSARLFRGAVGSWYARQGWRAEGGPPDPKRCVIIAAPHTSNWDFPYMLGVSQALGVRLNWIGKQSLFRWPFGGLMRRLGGIPVDRSRSANVVTAMIEEFARREEFMLIVAPEGTRSKVGQWKTGFYHIALGAGVPLVCGLLDYGRKVGGLGPAFMPTGDYARDMAVIAAFYKSCTPRHPDRAVTDFGIGASEEPVSAGQ